MISVPRLGILMWKPDVAKISVPSPYSIVGDEEREDA